MKKIILLIIFSTLLSGLCVGSEPNIVNDELCRNNSLTQTLLEIFKDGNTIEFLKDDNVKYLSGKTIGTFYKGPIKENEEKIIGYKYETLLIVVSQSKQKYTQRCVTNHDLLANITRITCFKNELDIFVDP